MITGHRCASCDLCTPLTTLKLIHFNPHFSELILKLNYFASDFQASRTTAGRYGQGKY